MQALCFLIAETAQQTAGLNSSKDRALEWRTSPFYFRAFKIAVGKLLDALEPKGKIEPPVEMQFILSEDAEALEYDFLKSFRDPEARGAYAARSIWASLRNVPLHTREEDEADKKRLRERSEAAYFRELYGMPNAGEICKSTLRRTRHEIRHQYMIGSEWSRQFVFLSTSGQIGKRK